MKKVKIAAVSALAAFSVFGSTAMADTAPAAPTTAAAKTTADYKDLGSISADLRAKIDVLLAKGIMEGVSADTFGIQQNMTRAQFAKVLDLMYNVPVDKSVLVSSFTDVKADDSANGWSIPYVEAAKKAGLIDGMTDSTFAPADNVTVGQLATALIKGVGKKVDVSGRPWYAKALEEAKKLGFAAAAADGAAYASRTDLVIGAYAGQGAFHDLPKPSNPVSILSAKASDAQTVQVAFDQSVDSSKAMLTLSQGTTVVSTTTVWSGDKTAAITLTGAYLATGDYTVTLRGLAAADVKSGTASFHYESPATSATGGGINYTTGQTYVLANVIDSGTTSLATGTGGFVAKTAAEDPTVSKFAKEIVITAKTASGDTVALPGIIQSMISSNPSVVKVGVAGDHRGYALGVKAGTAVINLTFKVNNGDVKQASVPVTVKADPVAVDKIEAGNPASTVNTTLNSGVYTGTFNAFTAMNLKITDNYGSKYENDEGQKYNFALGVLFTVDNVRGASSASVGSVTVDGSGNVDIAGNVTSFDLTAVSIGGKQTTTAITVNQI